MDNTLKELYEQITRDTDLVISQTAPQGLNSNIIWEWRQKQDRIDKIPDPMHQVINGLALLGTVLEKSEKLMPPQVACSWRQTVNEIRHTVSERQHS